MKASPDTPQSLYQKGQSLWQQGKANEAFQYFQSVLSQTDKRPHYLLAITGLLVDGGYYAQGIEVLRQYSADTQESADLQLRLASLHMKLEQLDAAIVILKTCVDQNPDCVEAYTLLAENYGQLNDSGSAAGILSVLMQRNPKDIEIHKSAASYLSAIGAEQAALEAYELCLTQHDCDAATLSSVARLHFSLGEFDKSTDYNLKAISKDVNCAASYLGIAISHKFTSDDKAIAEQFKAALEQKLDTQTITSLNFSLGKISDDLESYDAAFSYFEAANKKHLSVMSPAFSLTASEHQFRSIKNYFTSQKISQLQNVHDNESRPIFIVGMPRSGTTLLERIFSSDENVFVAGELETLDLMPTHMENSTENRIQYPQVLSHLPPAAMEYYCEQYLASATHEFSGYRHILDKNPLNFANIGLIKSLFPKALIIHCRRAPLDNFLSLYFQYFAHRKMDFSYDLDTLAQYYVFYLDMMQHWQDQGVELLDVHYEDLVSDLDTVIGRLSQFTGLKKLSPKRPTEMSESIHTASVWQARQDIHGNSVNRSANYQDFLADYIGRYPGIFS